MTAKVRPKVGVHTHIYMEVMIPWAKVMNEGSHARLVRTCETDSLYIENLSHIECFVCFYSIQIIKTESHIFKSLSLASLHDKNHKVLEVDMLVFGIIL